jgi:hypothetical protein
MVTSVIIGALVGGAHAAGSGSNSSSDGSKGSDDSSRSSGDSSKNSGDSSGESGRGSRNSTENSPRDSSQDSSNSKGGAALSVGALIVVVGGLMASGVVVSVASSRRNQQRVQALATFLQRNHALVTRDLVAGDGPLLASWGRGLGLTAAERDRLGAALLGSPEQTELLQALDGRIDEARARRFAAGFTRLGRRALGEQRFRSVAGGTER